jgi:hypothetical protein
MSLPRRKRVQGQQAGHTAGISLAEQADEAALQQYQQQLTAFVAGTWEGVKK